VSDINPTRARRNLTRKKIIVKPKPNHQPFIASEDDDTIARRLSVEIEHFLEQSRLALCPRKACKHAGKCRAALITDCLGHKA
jgi:hypothetical protein